jgi:hypothetical protein
VSGKWLERLVGGWVWVLLCNRPALSVTLQASYRYINYFESKPGVLWESVREELECLMSLIPLLYQDLDCQFSDYVYCTDASDIGGGFTYATAGASTALRLAQLGNDQLQDPAHPNHGVIRDFASSHTHVWGSSHPWRRTADPVIARLVEFNELRAAVRHYARRPGSCRSRLSLLCDNGAVVGAVNKGRSSCFLMNAQCRRLAAYLLGGRIRLHCTYIPTDVNPADAPSRAARSWRRLRAWGSRR